YLDYCMENPYIDMFVIVSLAFYLNRSTDSTDKKQMILTLNNIIEKRINIFLNSSYFANISKSDRNLITHYSLISSEYYTLNAFYHYPEISKKNKEKIEKIIYNDK